MVAKTYADLSSAPDVQDGDLLASFRGTGPLKNLTAAQLKNYITTALGDTYAAQNGSNILGANQAAFLAQIGGVSQTALALGSGSTLVGYQDAGTGSIPTTVSAFIKSQAINVVTQFGVATTNTQAQNVTAFNNAIAAANAQKRMLYVPDSGGSAYQIDATLNRITNGLGIIGDGPDKSVIHLYSLGSGVVIKGYYKTSRDYIVINKSAAGTGTTGKGCVHLINWAYGICERTYTAHDLNGYAGILLEQEYDGSASDAAFLTHLGCWYNRFNGIDCLYTTQAAASRGYGLHFTVNANAVGVINPPGEAPGTYTGSCNYNTIDMPNIEQRVEGARLERATNNIFRGGQFLGSQTQVRGINSPGNWFEFTRHNQWLTEPFNMDSNSTGTVILYPSLFNITAQPWSLGTLNRSDIAVRSDQKGTFTPNIKFGTSTAGITYSRQGGTYSKQDNVVTCTFDIRLSSKGVQTGGLSIEGLPFSSVNSSADGIAVCTLYFYSGFTGTGKIGTGYTGGGTVITEIVDHAIAITNVQLTDTAIIFGNITYITPTK